MGEAGLLTTGLLVGEVEGEVEGSVLGLVLGEAEGSRLGLVEGELLVLVLGEVVVLALGSAIVSVVLVISRSALLLAPFTSTWVVSLKVRLAEPIVLALAVKVATVPCPV